jgi:alanine dehydrogenase
VLLAPLPGVHPAEVCVIGAGTLGLTAARQFARIGVSVHLLEHDLDRLEACWDSLPPNVFTALATPESIRQISGFANAVVIAVRTAGPRAPIVLTEQMVRDMRPGSVVLDFSIDNGGGAATSRPISRPEDAYSVHGVLHFSMPNAPSLVARTASKRLSHALLPFVHQLAGGAAPRAHRTFAQAVWWGEEPA